MRSISLLCALLLSSPLLYAQPTVTEVQKLLASDAQSGDYFGYSVSLSGDRAVVGAVIEDAGGGNAGASYVYERDGFGVWQEVQKLVASDAQAGDEFGYSVSISGDRAVVGARLEDPGVTNAGAAYVYERDGAGVWQEVQKLVASDAQVGDLFGTSVSISGDRLVVGAEGEDAGGTDNAGAAYVYERDGAGVWQEVQKLVASDAQVDDLFGTSVSISGDRLVVGARGEGAGGTGAGAAYVYERDGVGIWQEVQKLVASDAQAFDFFGESVSISGDRLVVGAYAEDAGGSNAGAAYVYERDGAGVWQEVQKLVASDAQPDDFFGWSVSISGDRAVVGAMLEDAGGTNAGAAYVYERDGAGVWQEVQKLVASDAQADDRFGWSVSVSGDRAFVGAVLEDAGGSLAGAAYVYEVLPTANTWTGTNGTDWNDGGNWSSGSVPGAADETIIPTAPSGGNFPSVDFDLTVDDLTVQTGATVDIEPGFVLAIGANGTIDAQGTITLQSDATGTAILDDFTNAGAVYTGDLTVETFVAGGLSGENQHYISSPVDAPNVAEIGDDLSGPFGAGLPGTDGVAVTPLPSCDVNQLDVTSNYGNLFELDESNITTCFQERWIVRSSGTLTNGEGYSAWLPAGSTAEWTGTPNTGSVAGPIVTTTGASTSYPEHYRWNLVGNPYPSPMNIDFFLGANPWMISPLQYEPSGPFAGTYQGYAPGSNVAIGQGFMAQATSTNLVSYGDFMRRTGPADWKTTTSDYFEHKLDIEVHGNGFADRTEVFFNQEASADFDMLYDRTKVPSDAGQPTISTGNMLAMNGLHLQDMQGRIPVTIQPGAAGSFELRFSGIETFDASTAIYLEDAWTGERVNLRTTDSYTVDLGEGSTNDRFHLVFEKNTTGVEDLAAYGIDVYSHRDVVTIDLTTAEAERSDVVITDMTGRVVAAAGDLARERTKLTVPTAAGIYTVTVVQDGRRVSEQVAIVR